MHSIGHRPRLVGYGVRVPDEISVVGFDDIPLAEMTYPPLTTVRFPRREAGAAAVDRLLRVLARAGAPAGDPARPPSPAGCGPWTARSRRTTPLRCPPSWWCADPRPDCRHPR